MSCCDEEGEVKQGPGFVLIFGWGAAAIGGAGGKGGEF